MITSDVCLAIIAVYLSGAVITVVSQGTHLDGRSLDRRVWLWPLFWLYLVADFVRELVRIPRP